MYEFAVKKKNGLVLWEMPLNRWSVVSLNLILINSDQVSGIFQGSSKFDLILEKFEACFSFFVLLSLEKVLLSLECKVRFGKF